jgi:hypothetical protein
MRLAGFLSPRHFLWPWLGGVALVGCVGASLWFMLQGPSPIQPVKDAGLFQGGLRGRLGTAEERLDSGTFLLQYESGESDGARQMLEGVSGRLVEPLTTWTLRSPRAERSQSAWTLQGPMEIEARDSRTGVLQGHGRIAQAGPALRWEKGRWHGLAPLAWTSLLGTGRGAWALPAGWRRELDTRFVVERGPVSWLSQETGILRAMQAERMWVLLGMDQARMEGVSADMKGGRVHMATSLLDATSVRWEPPITFWRDDGWQGQAESGLAPRPPEGRPAERAEFRGFLAHRQVPEGEQRLHAEGARWTPEGLRLEGNVCWEMPQKAETLSLRAPRLLFRQLAGGSDLPEDLPPGQAWAEGMAVLTWGRNSLSSPRLEAREADRSWVVQAPSHGRAKEGTFAAGRGFGRPERWEFEGPVQASGNDGSTLRGGRLVWENDIWTLTGRPVTYVGLRQRFSTSRLVRQGDQLQFPEGVSGALASPRGDRDMTFRADRGERRGQLVDLRGRVEVRGAGWRLNADHISVTLGSDRTVSLVTAGGKVTLEGQMGEGRGEDLELDLRQNRARWQGKVRGTTEVRS